MGNTCCQGMNCSGMNADPKNGELTSMRKATQYITEDQFRLNAQPGDVILFKSNNMLSGVTRKLTKADYDHVALVIRLQFDPSEVFLLEAVNSGVQLTRWSVVRKYIASSINPTTSKECYYLKAAFRHVETRRGKWFYSMIQDFMIQTLGKTYEISYQKLTKRETFPKLPNQTMYSEMNSEMTIPEIDQSMRGVEHSARKYRGG